MGFLGTIAVLDIAYGDGAGGDLEAQADEPGLTITCTESKATVASWSYLGRFIIAGHEDGSVSQYDSKVTWISGFIVENGTAGLIQASIVRGSARERPGP